MIAFLESIRETNHSDYVFPGRSNNKPLQDPKKTWAAIQKHAGISGVRIHDIRHTVLSDIVAFADVQTAAVVAGHKTIQSTLRYVHGRSEVAKKALDQASEGRKNMLGRVNAKDE